MAQQIEYQYSHRSGILTAGINQIINKKKSKQYESI